MIKILETLNNPNNWIGNIQKMYLHLVGSEIKVPMNKYVEQLDYQETNDEINYIYKELMSKYDIIKFDHYLESNLINIFHLDFGYKEENIKIIINNNDENRIITIKINLASKEYPNDTSIDDLDLSVRTYNCLRRAGINTVADIKNANLNKVRALGNKGINEL